MAAAAPADQLRKIPRIVSWISNASRIWSITSQVLQRGSVPFDARLYTRAAPIRTGTSTAEGFSPARILRWWRAPFWAAALLTGAKSFIDNPVLGSRRLNRAGLHVWRLRPAPAMGWGRRRRLAKLIAPELRRQFDRDGFIVIRDFLPHDAFRAIRSAAFEPGAE